MDTFGEWLRQQRNLLGLTREQFAGRVGCSVALLRKVEDGERRPSVQIAELMANSLNIPPQERSTFVKVARGELTADRLSPVLNPATFSKPPQSNLPIFSTPFVGRQREVDELSNLLNNPDCRLLTLVGPGGIGKTRLAIETAAQMQDIFADGVFFVSLASVDSTRYIVPMIADAMDFTFESANHADPKAQLFSYLHGKQTLLLIDNLEQLLAEAGVELLAELLAHAPQVKLITTSRESLGLQDEWVFEVYGLPVPENMDAEASVQETSVELFLQRARRAHVRFSPMPEDYPAILHVCQLTDGNPLGIELAAAWVRTLSCSEIEHEIENGMDFLRISARDIPVRHRSIRAVFNQSWKLLTEAERVSLLRLTAFQGGFRREAAEQVADATLPLLSILVQKSLIRRSGAGRYDLHELIRQFAVEQLAGRPEEFNEVQSRHGRYYLDCFSQADRRLRSVAQPQTLAELTAEMDNFRAAWDWAVAQGEFVLIEQTLRTFVRLHDTRGWYQEGLDTLARTINALERSPGSPSPDRSIQLALGHLLTTRSWLDYRLANYKQAQRMLERSLEILQPLSEPHVLVESITYLGRVMEMTGDYPRALELYSQGLELATEIGNQWFRAVCLTLQTALVGFTHVMVSAEITHERLLSVVAEWRLIGDPRLIAFGLDFLSRSALRLGRYEEARTALEENVALNSSIGFVWGLGSAYRALGIVAQAQGKHFQAVEEFHKSLDTFTELGGIWWVARVLADMSWSILALGNDSEAERTWRESMRIATEIHGTPVVLEALAGLAYLQAQRENLDSAHELLLMVLDHPASFHKTRNRAAVLRAELEAQMTGQQVDAAVERAQAKSLETVVAEVIQQA